MQLSQYENSHERERELNTHASYYLNVSTRVLEIIREIRLMELRYCTLICSMVTT